MTLIDFSLWSQNTKCTTVNRNILSLQISGGFALPSSTVICWGRELVTYLLWSLFDSIRWLCLVLSYTSLLAGSAKRLGSSGRFAPPCLLGHSACSWQQVTQLPAGEAQGVQRQRQKLPVFSQSQALQPQPRSREKRKRSRSSTRGMSRVQSYR